MNVNALAIYLPKNERIGVLFQYVLGDQRIVRFVADDAFLRRTDAPTVSVLYLAESPAQQASLWQDIQSHHLNGRFSNKNGWLLPAFFQNLLPEGVFRDRIAELRHCDRLDHFELLAACGKDLPGGVYALPVTLSRDELARYVTQHNDALEMSVTAEPLEEGVSLSGVQPKVGVIHSEGRYVARTKNEGTHIIAKLPVAQQPCVPELEELSLRLAHAAGVNTCQAWLEPLATLKVTHGYDLGAANAQAQFLAVQRFDRGPQGRLHCEDFAQVLGVMPEDKYGALRQGERNSYLDVALVLMAFDTLGEPAVHELLRRLVVNEMLGNPDMHLKNIGLLYPDGRTPILSPAYDIVAYAALYKHTGHALQLLPKSLQPQAEQAAAGKRRTLQLSPALVRAFCSALGIPEKPAASAIQRAVKLAFKLWPDLIQGSQISALQKERLLGHFEGHAMVASLRRRGGQRTEPSG